MFRSSEIASKNSARSVGRDGFARRSAQRGPPERGLQAGARAGGGLLPVPGEVHRRGVVECEAVVAEIRRGVRVPAGPGTGAEIIERVFVPGGLGHLLAVDQQMGGMHPNRGEPLPRGGHRHRPGIFVVRKAEVDSADVDVELGTEVLDRHRGALDVPSRPPPPPAALPLKLPPGFGGQPEGEILRALLVPVDPLVRPLRDLPLPQGGTRKEPVPGGLRHVEVEISSFPVDRAPVLERGNERDHLRDVLRGPRVDVGRQERHAGAVAEERLREEPRDLLRRLPGRAGGGDHLVLALLQLPLVHVSHVRDVLDGEGAVPPASQGADEKVGKQVRPKVPDVSVTVDGGAARVDADSLRVGGCEGEDPP